MRPHVGRRPGSWHVVVAVLVVAAAPAAHAVHAPPTVVVADAVPVLTASVFVTPVDGWALSSVGEGADQRWLALRTQDGGLTWQERHRSERPLAVLDATAPSDVWIGGSGVVLHSPDDGARWTTGLVNRGLIDVVAVDAVDAQTALVAASSGQYASVWSSRDAGARFVEERVLPVSRPLGRPVGVAQHGGSALVVTAEDPGWRRIAEAGVWMPFSPCVPECQPEDDGPRAVLPPGTLVGAWSDSAQHVIAVTDDGDVLRTLDGGLTWTWRWSAADPGGDGRIGAVSRSGTTLAAADADAVAVSADDGVTWRTARVAPGAAVVTSVAVLSPGTVYVTVREPGAATARAVTVHAR